MGDTETAAPLTGGCQCGRIRYRAAGGVEPVSLCHCRMCQRATGGLFMAIVPVERACLDWVTQPADGFESSTIARRLFCSACGSPIGFEFVGGEYVCVTIGTLDDPDRVPLPGRQVGLEGRVAWFHDIADWPQMTSDDNDSITPERRARFVSQQDPRRQT